MRAERPASPCPSPDRGFRPASPSRLCGVLSAILAAAILHVPAERALALPSGGPHEGASDALPERRGGGQGNGAVPEVKAHPGVEAGALSAFAEQRVRLLREMGRLAGIRVPGGRLPSYELYSDHVQKGTLTGRSAPVDLPDGKGRIRRVLDLPCAARDGEAEAAWLMSVAWGVEPLPLWSAGLAGLHAPALYGRKAAELAGALAGSGFFPSLDELLEAPSELRQYPTLFSPAAAVLVGWILEEQGPGGLKKAVTATSGAQERLPTLAGALGTDAAGLRRGYAQILRRYAADYPKAHTRSRAGAPPGRQRGVCYAHRVSLRSGYASPRAALQLDRLKEMGVNWISVTPFGYLELHSPEIAASSAFGSEGETDESIGVVIAEARGRGLGVMVKPHLWSSDFVGRISMRTPEDWARFFREYGRYVLHHAILAESCDASALSVGNELIECTRGHDREWRRIILSVRSVFAGPLTYGAHWAEEVEQIGFWDMLDWVGVSLYAPLATNGDASKADLREGARRQARRLEVLARRVGRPLLLVEAGFPTHRRAAIAPWEEQDGGPVDLEAQADAYEALLSTFWPLPFLEGVYWWKWFSDGPSAPGRCSHCFAGTPAEDVVRRFYRVH